MTSRKPAPSDGLDGRRVYPIDELRARVWYFHVKKLSGCGTNDALATEFDDLPKKWANYEKGGQPNELVLNKVETKYPGTLDIYIAGPNRLKLWPAIRDNEQDNLSLISTFSKRVDGLIAQLRLDVITGKIQLPDGDGSGGWPEEPDIFELRIIEVLDMLPNEIEKQFMLEIEALLRNFLQPFVDSAYFAQKQDFDDFIYDSRANNAYSRELLDKERFNSIQLSTVKQKGRRKNDE